MLFNILGYKQIRSVHRQWEQVKANTLSELLVFQSHIKQMWFFFNETSSFKRVLGEHFLLIIAEDLVCAAVPKLSGIYM